jgi:hypothetical protein
MVGEQKGRKTVIWYLLNEEISKGSDKDYSVASTQKDSKALRPLQKQLFYRSQGQLILSTALNMYSGGFNFHAF